MQQLKRLVFGILPLLTIAISLAASCSPGRYYCGTQVAHLIRQSKRAQNTTIYLCEPDGESLSISHLCYEGCKHGEEGSDGFCLCKPKKQYCGRQLNEFLVEQYDDDTLYMCNESGSNVSLIEKCQVGCKEGSPSLCHQTCLEGKLYCGIEMKELGWRGDGLATNILYQCETAGTNISVWATCTDGCEVNRCKCRPGELYCAHELYHQLGWMETKDGPTDLFQCASNGLTVAKKRGCNKCIAKNSSAACDPECQSSRCDCTFDFRYCGHELAERGWTGYGNHTVYQCIGSDEVKELKTCDGTCLVTSNSAVCGGDCAQGYNYCGYRLNELGFEGRDNDTLYACNPDGRNTTVWSMCAPGTCESHYCKCDPDRYYCGYELYAQLGWTNHKGRSELYKCYANGSMVSVKYRCDTCMSPSATKSSRCTCQFGYHYCGHELLSLGWHGHDNQTLYECHSSGDSVRELEKCQSTCRRMDRYSICGGKCIRGNKYCGSLLRRMGYEGYKNESLYLCTDDNLPLVDTGESHILCHKQCTPGRSYCGHEIQYVRDAGSSNHHERFICQNDGSFKSTAVCSTCMNDGSGAYCSCIPGWRYCGRIIYETGWQGFTESYLLPLLYTNDTIFRCKDENEVEYVETCPHGECRNDVKNAHCLCTTNRTYCGHELYQHYNSGDTYLYPHYIYRCSRTRQTVIEEEKCNTCYRLNGSPKCRQECAVGRYYCGSDLLALEGWQNQDVDVNSLYKCDNSTSAQQITECSAGCISAAADPSHDAYCATPTTPWYWFLIGIGVPVVVITLGLVLARIGVNHRRLKRSIEAQRIDANQLIAGIRLGKGEFGDVWQATYKPTEGHPVEVALKVSQGKADATAKLACANCFLQEIVALDILSHQNIIKAFGICTNYKDQMGNTVAALVLEYMNGGSAISYLRSEHDRVISRDLLQIFTDVCQGGDHLCKMGIIHRDIGARNVLVQKDPNTGRVKVAKLTDFGLAKDIGKLTSMYKSTHPDRVIIHCRYTAPEGFRGEFSPKSDVWSFAVLMWELYTVLMEDPTRDSNVMQETRPGPMPYSEICEAREVLEEVRGGLKLKQPKMCPDDIYRRMVQCWDKTPEARPSFKEMIKFFNSKQGTNDAQVIMPLPLPEATNDESFLIVEPHTESLDQQIEGYTRAAF